ncbi:MAG: hypothetical protein ACRDMH_07050 [Solirubrobacterales bacterium]
MREQGLVPEFPTFRPIKPSPPQLIIGVMSSNAESVDALVNQILSRRWQHSILPWPIDDLKQLEIVIREEDPRFLVLDEPSEEVWTACVGYRDAGDRKIPKLMVLTPAEEVDAAKSAGADYVVAKPYEERELDKAVRSAAERDRAGRSEWPLTTAYGLMTADRKLRKSLIAHLEEERIGSSEYVGGPIEDIDELKGDLEMRNQLGNPTIDLVILDEPDEEIWKICVEGREKADGLITLMVLVPARDAEAAKAAGADFVVSKPFEMAEIDRALLSFYD